MTSKNKRKFALILAAFILISLVFSMLIWKWFGKDYNLSFGILEVDFFNTFSGTIGMIGLSIAIYQIAELRNETEIRSETIQEVETKNFKNTTIYSFGSLKPALQALQATIIKQSIVSEDVINAYINTITDAGHTFNIITYHQQNLTCEAVIDCKKLLTLQGQILGDLYQIINDKSFVSFPKQKFIQNIGDLISDVSLCETILKT